MSAQVRDDNGFITIRNNPISAAGVFPYLGRSIGAPDPDRVYNVFRPPEAWSDPEAMDSVRHVPLVNDHDMIGGDGTGYMAAEDKGVHGITCQNVTFDGKTLKADLKIFSQTLANMVKSGRKSLSLGYRCKYEPATGTYDGKEYQYRQTNLRVNHLALVAQGRVPGAAVLDHTMAYDHIDIPLENAKQELEMAEAKETALDAAEVAKIVQTAMDAALAPVMARLVALDEKVKDKEDDETEEEKKARLAKEKKEDKEDKAMDAAEVDRLVEQRVGVAMDAMFNTAKQAEAKRVALIERVTPYIGVFDHSEMATTADVASYARKKLELADIGQDEAVLAGYMAAKAPPSARDALALDASVTASAFSAIDAFFKGK